MLTKYIDLDSLFADRIKGKGGKLFDVNDLIEVTIGSIDSSDEKIEVFRIPWRGYNELTYRFISDGRKLTLYQNKLVITYPVTEDPDFFIKSVTIYD